MKSSSTTYLYDELSSFYCYLSKYYYIYSSYYFSYKINIPFYYYCFFSFFYLSIPRLFNLTHNSFFKYLHYFLLMRVFLITLKFHKRNQLIRINQHHFIIFEREMLRDF